jgi:MoxR-like ATPase
MPRKSITPKKGRTGQPAEGVVPKQEIPETTSVYLTKPLGLLGWDELEPVLLAALATKEPLLLIGKHGTAKSFLLERLAQALDLKYRFYNASLVNYDDLVGIPVPDAAQTSLRYISTPTAIWDAEVVFIDELNRTRPDLQNKLFSIIHERRVQGVRLEKLQYRWAAMNPPPSDQDDPGEVYLGAEPLDPALADRFGFLIEVPDWCDLSASERKTLLLDQFRGRHEFPVNVAELVAHTTATFEAFCQTPPDLTDYFVSLEAQLRSAGTRFSSRRLSTLFRTALGIHAARITLSRLAGKDGPPPDLGSTLFLSLVHGHPGLAAGPIDHGALLAIHRQAWSIAGLRDNDPWKDLLNIPDPVERVLRVVSADFPITESELSSLVLEAVASQPNDELRSCLSLVLYLTLRTSRKIAATAAETLSSQLTRVLNPHTTTHQVYGSALTRCREVANICSGLGDSPRDCYARNLLNAFLPDGFKEISPGEMKSRFEDLWERFGLPVEDAP